MPVNQSGVGIQMPRFHFGTQPWKENCDTTIVNITNTCTHKVCWSDINLIFESFLWIYVIEYSDFGFFYIFL